MDAIPLLEFADTFTMKNPGVEKARVPLQATLEITKLCSLKCKHCYIGDGRWKKNPQEISTQELLDLLDVLAQRGTLWLTFTGGEPLIRRDFPLLWKAAQEKGFLLQLFTNATLFTPPIQDLLREIKPTKVEVSIYGASASTYESLTQIPGSFNRFLEGLNFIKSLGVPWLLKAPVLKENLEEVTLLRAFAKEYGAPIHFTAAIQPSTGKGETSGMAPCATRVEPEEAAAFELGDAVGTGDALKNWSSNLSVDQKEEPLFECDAGKNSFYVTAEAEVQMCNMTIHRKQSLRKDLPVATAFDEAWQKFGEARKILRPHDSPCHRCDLKSICQNCPGFAHLETKREDGAVEWLCKQTHIKAKLLGIPHKCSDSHFVHARKKSSS